MRLLSWLLAVIFIPLVLTDSLLYSVDQTLLNGHFLKSQLSNLDIYTDAVSYLPGQLIAEQTLSPQEKAQAVAKIQQAITPNYLQQEVEQLIDQAEAIRNGKATSLQLDISESIAKLRKAGLPIELASVEPITFSLKDQPQAQLVLESLRTAEIIDRIAVLLLVILILMLVWRYKAYSSLITALFLIMIGEIIFGIGVKQIPPLIIQKMAMDNPIINHFAPKIELLAQSTSQSMANTYALVAVISFVLAVGLFILSRIIHRERPARLPFKPS